MATSPGRSGLDMAATSPSRGGELGRPSRGDGQGEAKEGKMMAIEDVKLCTCTAENRAEDGGLGKASPG